MNNANWRRKSVIKNMTATAANKAAQATSFSLMLVRCLQDYGLDDVISAVYTPLPLVISRHQWGNPPPPLDDDVICGCPQTCFWVKTENVTHVTPDIDCCSTSEAAL